MKVALKEIRETLVWLKIIERKALWNSEKMQSIIQECNELVAIFISSVKTADKHKAEK